MARISFPERGYGEHAVIEALSVLKILMVEDVPADAEITVRELKRSSIAPGNGLRA